MALTPSNMPELGRALPNFNCPNVLGGAVDQASAMAEQGLLVAFICNHCPYVVHIQEVLTALANSWVNRGLGVVFISSNDIETYPQDGPEPMADLAKRLNFTFPYLYDASQSVAKSFEAACTPDFFLYDAQASLVYRGQFDASRPGNDVPVTGQNLSQAVERLLHGQSPVSDQIPSVGCNIKWKAGSALA